MTMTIQSRPEFGKLYGITYSKETHAPIVRTPRVLKVTIGVPKGKAISVFLHGGKWHIRFGKWEEGGGKKKLVMKTVYRGGSSVGGVTMSNERTDVEAWFHANKADAAVSNRPQKIPYFSFTRRTIFEDEGGRPCEVFEPDFEAIEAHGDAPRRIPVILTSDNALYQELSMWSAAELKCHGDGLIAERVISMGSANDPGWQEAKNAGQKTFTYSPCATGGCPHYGVDCKPHSTLKLQLAYAQRHGATAYFATTSVVSAGQLFSSLTEIRGAVERCGYSIAGIPMDLVLGSFKASHEGKPSIQPCVSLELRAQGSKRLNEILAENAWIPVQLGAKQIQAAVETEPETEPVVFDAHYTMTNLPLDGDTSEPDFDEEAPQQSLPPAATATQAKQEAISEQLRKAQNTPPLVVHYDPAATTAPEFPWHSPEEMRSGFKAMQKALTPDKFTEILTKHRKIVGTLKDDEGTLAAYQEMLKESDPF